MPDIPGSIVAQMGARIDTLEMRVAHQDDVIDQLNKVVVDQWTKIDQLLGRLGRLENRVSDPQDTGTQDGHVEPPPPHY